MALLTDSTAAEERSRPHLSKLIAPGADDVNTTAAPSSEQLRLQQEWDQRMGVVNNPVRYDKTAVMLMYWDPTEDDLEITEEVSVEV